MRMILAATAAVLVVSCVAPAAKSPLKEKLATLGDSELESVTRACLEHDGWTVDPFPSAFGDSRRLHATKKDHQVALYLYPKTMVPRITGGMSDDAFPLWSCLRVTIR
jgi:hypothetical protein